jgi:hypothetical protein
MVPIDGHCSNVLPLGILFKNLSSPHPHNLNHEKTGFSGLKGVSSEM